MTNIKEYLKNVYDLEKSLYEQKMFLNKMKKQYDIVNGYKEEQHYVYQKNMFEEEPLMNLKNIAYCTGVVLVITYLIATYLVEGLNCPGEIGIALIFAIPLSTAIILTGIFIGETRDIEREQEQKKKDIEQENKKIDWRNEQLHITKKKQLAIINAEYKKLEAEYKKTANILNQYYDKNIIFAKYRNFVAVSSFYEYFISGRCITFEGHEGAYNIYENEIRLNVVIQKLDDVIRKLDQIQNNQYMLYSAIQECNKNITRLSRITSDMTNKLQDISQNVEISAYYNSITAVNTEAIKWLEFSKI